MGKARDFFRKIRDTKGTFHVKMGSIKDRSGMDLTEAEDVKKRWQEYTELYKKDHDPDNHNDITMNKASGGDGIPVELFQILKDDAVKCCTLYVSKFGKLSSGHRTGKGQFSFQSQRKAMPKHVKITTQLHSSHTLAK